MKTIQYIHKENGEVAKREGLHRWLDKMLDALPDGEAVMELNPSSKTDAQNKFYFVCVGIIARSLGMRTDDMHKVMKEMFLPSREYIVLIKHKQVNSTNELDKDEASEYIDKVIEFAAENGIIIPDPEEYKHN